MKGARAILLDPPPDHNASSEPQPIHQRGERLRTSRQRATAPLRVRVTLSATAAALVGAVLGSFLFVALLRGNLQDTLGSSASSEIDTVQAQLRNGATAKQSVVSGRTDVIVQIMDPRGRLIATDHPRITSRLSPAPGLSKGVRVTGLRDSYSVVARRIFNGDTVVAGRSEEQVGEAIGSTTALLSLSVPVGLAALALVVWISVGRALRPVEAMRRQAAAITSDHLHRRVAVPPGADEIARLAATLNTMLDGIDASDQLQRQFVSDASHELRSPLAAMRQLGEVARRYPDRVETTELARDVLIEERRMEDLVTALLTLARLDDGTNRVSAEVDLDDIVLDEVALLRTQQGAAFDVSAVSAGRVSGNGVLLAQVTRNLLSNARRHAASRVVVELGEGPRTVRLVVHDDGTGIPVPDRDRVFERFTRLDEARHRDAGGSGLGLAIVRKVVEGMSGTVRVDSGPLGGARFTVELPAA